MKGSGLSLGFRAESVQGGHITKHGRHQNHTA